MDVLRKLDDDGYNPMKNPRIYNVEGAIGYRPVCKPQTTGIVLKEEFEDTKGAIRIRISKTNRQHNGQKIKYKRTDNDLQNIHIKLKIE